MMRDSGAVARDSKLMTAEHRERVVAVLRELSVPCSVAEVQAQEIDALGLGAANRHVLCAAVESLCPCPDHVLVDAFKLARLRCSHDAIVRGDSISLAIALASIVAKVHRDALMVDLCREMPQFGFSAHKGYGTAQHRAALVAHGPSEHHRKSFRPIREMNAHGALDC